MKPKEVKKALIVEVCIDFMFSHITKQLSGTAGPDSASRSSSVASAAAREKSVSYCYQLPPYLWKKSCQIVQISWRFLELHLHKFSMLVLFWVVLSEVSAGYWVLLSVSLVVIPLPYFNKIIYPLLTLYVGLLLVIKTTYQFPIVAQYMFNLTTFNGTDDGGQCSDTLVSKYTVLLSAFMAWCMVLLIFRILLSMLGTILV